MGNRSIEKFGNGESVMANITQENLLRLIKKTGDIGQYEKTVNNIALASSRRLVETTGPKKHSKHISKPWTAIKKIGKASFRISNNILTEGKKWNVAKLLNDGTRSMTKSKGFFYIPLSSKGRNKKLGTKIDHDRLKFGVDYVLTKRRRGIKGSHFIDKEEKRAQRLLLGAIAKRAQELIR